MILPQNLNFRVLLELQFGVSLAVTLIAWLMAGQQLAASTGFGAALMLLNLLALGWTWARVFQKKSIAWTSLIIVIKYAVLLISIFYLAHQPGLSPLGVGLGVSSLVITVLLLSFGVNQKTEAELISKEDGRDGSSTF